MDDQTGRNAVAPKRPIIRGTYSAGTALAIAVMAGALFIAAVEWTVLNPLPSLLPDGFVFLKVDSVIALLSGAVTAAGLTMIYLQIKGARIDAEIRAKMAIQEAAQRADLLHAEFNTPEMRQHRTRGYSYIEALHKNTDRRNALARYWVSGKGETIPPIDASADDSSEIVFGDEEWALSTMLAFYFRLAMHIEQNREHLGDRDLAEVFGPFYVSDWLHNGLLAFVVACEQASDTMPTLPKPYFAKAIHSLATIYPAPIEPDKTRVIPLSATQPVDDPTSTHTSAA